VAAPCRPGTLRCRNRPHISFRRWCRRAGSERASPARAGVLWHEHPEGRERTGDARSPDARAGGTRSRRQPLIPRVGEREGSGCRQPACSSVRVHSPLYMPPPGAISTAAIRWFPFVASESPLISEPPQIETAFESSQPAVFNVSLREGALPIRLWTVTGHRFVSYSRPLVAPYPFAVCSSGA
jgi:hypothetical protein